MESCPHSNNQEACEAVVYWEYALPSEIVELIRLYSKDILSVDYTSDAYKRSNLFSYNITVIVNYLDGWNLSINARKTAYIVIIGFAELSKTIGTPGDLSERIITVDLLEQNII